jgi:hypothetical protein
VAVDVEDGHGGVDTATRWCSNKTYRGTSQRSSLRASRDQSDYGTREIWERGQPELAGHGEVKLDGHGGSPRQQSMPRLVSMVRGGASESRRCVRARCSYGQELAA